MPATNLGLVPGLLCTQALWAPQLAAPAGDPGHGRSLALADLSNGRRHSHEVIRQAPERVLKLALLARAPLRARMTRA